MTHVYERVLLRCQYAYARALLREWIEELSSQDGPQRHSLAAPVGRGTLPKYVLVSYERGYDPMRFDERWLVRWTPEGGGPYPDFLGDIRVSADPQLRCAVLEIQGELTPPRGAIGRAFDIALGSRIAAATARSLIRKTAAQLDAQYEQEHGAVKRV